MTVGATRQVDVSAGQGDGRRRWSRPWTWPWPWLLGAVVALVLVLYGATAFAVSGRVPSGTTVAGVDVGGADRARALAVLESELTPRLDDPHPVTVGDATDEIDPAAAGLEADLDATVDSLVGFSLDPRRIWAQFVGTSEADVVTTADEDGLRQVVAALGERVRSDVVEGDVTFDAGEPVVVEPVQARELREDEAVETLREQWPSDDAIALPADVEEPEVGTEAVDRALEELAGPATSGPLTVVVGDVPTELPAATVATTLAMEPRDGELALRVDGEALKAAVLAANPALQSEPQDAQIVIEDGAPVIVPAATGVTIDAAQLAEVALPALTSAERTATLDTAVAEPELTTAEAEALGVTEVVSEFSSTLTPDAGRTENLRIAARTVNGTLLLPGEVFSLNETLGERTREKGYNAAGAISGGRFISDVGGGVSQMATTLFNGMFFAGLEDVEHKAHSLYISRYPEGREATVNWNNVDLKFRNDSDYGVLIESWVAGNQVHTRFWSTKVWDIEAGKSGRYNYREPRTIYDDSSDCRAQGSQTGFDVDITRVFKQGGETVKTEEFTTRYSAQNRVVCAPEPTPTPTPPAPTQTTETAGTD